MNTETRGAVGDGDIDADSNSTPTSADVRTDETQFVEQFDLTVGTVKVEDKHSGDELVMWKVRAGPDDVACVSDSLPDAIMGCCEDLLGKTV